MRRSWSAAHNAMSGTGRKRTSTGRLNERDPAMNRLSRFATTVAVTGAPVQRTAPPYGRRHREHTAMTTSARRIVGLHAEMPLRSRFLGSVVARPGCTTRDDAATETAHNRGDVNMHTKKILAGALTSVSLAAAGLVLGAGAAQAIPCLLYTSPSPRDRS